MESDPPISCNKASVQQFPLKKKLFLQYCISFNLHQFTTPKFLFSFTCICTWHHGIKSNFQFLYKSRQENDWMFSCVTFYNLERQWDHQILWFSQKKIRGTINTPPDSSNWDKKWLKRLWLLKEIWAVKQSFKKCSLMRTGHF